MAPVPGLPAVLRPHEPVAERVLLPGDPGRALRLAQRLIAGPRMLNHHRGLWGYSGPAADGRALTVQSTGLGGPSAVAVIDDLVALGARRIVRVGTAAAAGATPLGSLLSADTVLARDGTSRALGAGDRLDADGALADALAAQGLERALAASVDVLGAASDGLDGAAAVDRTSAAVLAGARRAGVAAGIVLAITRAGEEHLDDERVAVLEAALGDAALAALSA